MKISCDFNLVKINDQALSCVAAGKNLEVLIDKDLRLNNFVQKEFQFADNQIKQW